MFGRRDNSRKINEVVDLSAKVLKVLYLLLIAASLYIVVVLFKETQIIGFIKTVIKVVSPLFIGILIAWLFDPFVDFLEKKSIKRTWGAVIAYLLLFMVLSLVLSALIPLLIEQVEEFIRMAPSIFDKVKVWVNDFFNHFDDYDGINSSEMKAQVFKTVESFASNVTTTMPQNFLNFVSKLFSWLGTVILGFIIGFFLIISFDNGTKLFSFIPKKYRGTTLEILDEINVSLRSYVKGAIIDSTLIFILSSIFLWLVGLKVPALFGLFCGLTNVIPYAGPYIGGAPAVIVGFTQSPSVGICTLIVIFVIQFLEGNFLQPLIMSKTTKLHPVTIMLGLLVFGYFWGIIGMLISTPVIAALKTIFKFYDDKYEIIKKEKIEISHD